MKNVLKLSLLLIFIIILSSCNATKMVTNMMMTEFDSDKDGYISYAEWESMSKEDLEGTKKEADKKGVSVEQYIKDNFNDVDTNGDGKISKEEMGNQFQK